MTWPAESAVVDVVVVVVFTASPWGFNVCVVTVEVVVVELAGGAAFSRLAGQRGRADDTTPLINHLMPSIGMGAALFGV